MSANMLSSLPAVAMFSLLVISPVFARLGEPSGNESAEPREGKQLEAMNASFVEAINASFADFSISSGGYSGYSHFATTTRYGDSTKAACGGLHTGELVSGTRYYNVASAQSMWANCESHGNCWCGASGGGSGTVGMGCLTCAKGRFLTTTNGAGGGGFASEEVIVVVGDLCPYDGNEKWCPEKAGQRNTYGSFNHLDFSHPPSGINNNNFVFTPISCPGDLQAKYQQISSCR